MRLMRQREFLAAIDDRSRAKASDPGQWPTGTRVRESADG